MTATKNRYLLVQPFYVHGAHNCILGVYDNYDRARDALMYPKVRYAHRPEIFSTNLLYKIIGEYEARLSKACVEQVIVDKTT